jgi:hypothetical protein
MSEKESARSLLGRFKDFIKGFGKPRDATVLRSKQSSEDTIPPLSDEMQAAKLARISNNRLTPLEEKTTPGKEQWQKLKKSAKENDSVEDAKEHWTQKHGSILSGTTFDAASTDVSRGQRKRPSVVTQSRITSHRLQALQAAMEKPKNDIDQLDEGDDNLPGH